MGIIPCREGTTEKGEPRDIAGKEFQSLIGKIQQGDILVVAVKCQFLIGKVQLIPNADCRILQSCKKVSIPHR